MLQQLVTAKREPYAYQASFLQEILSSKLRRLPLFWEMRLGKSFVVIHWLLAQRPQPQRSCADSDSDYRDSGDVYLA